MFVRPTLVAPSPLDLRSEQPATHEMIAPCQTEEREQEQFGGTGTIDTRRAESSAPWTTGGV